MGFSITNWETDKKKEIEGTWLEYGEGVEFKLARLTNPRLRAYIEKNSKGGGGKIGKRAIQEGTLDTKLLKKAVARFVILDWKNLTEPGCKACGNGESGEDKECEKCKGTHETDLPYSEAKALEYITKYEDFFEDILVMAQDISNFRLDQERESSGNS